MFGIGLGEFILILIIALIFISPEKLPEIAKAAAKTLNEFKKASAEIRRTVSDISFEEASKSASPHKPAEGAGNGRKDGAAAPEPEKEAKNASPSPKADEEKTDNPTPRT